VSVIDAIASKAPGFRPKVAVGASLIGHEVTCVDEQRGNRWEFLSKEFLIADTPCQPPEPGRFSATGVEVAVSVSAEMNGEHDAVIGTDSLVKGDIHPDDFE